MRVEILVLAALAAFVSAAPQWPYRDAVAPYYYGYPGKTPYMYRSGDEDDEMDESYLARQDLKVAANPANAGSTVTVVEDDEKADGVRVVETGSAKQVAQSGNNQQNDQNKPVAGSSSPAASQQAQQPQPLSNNNASPNNNNAQPQSVGSGQPLTATAQQPGQQPPQAFPPARPPSRPRPNEEDEDEEEDDSEEEDEEDAEDDEDGDSDEDDENDDEEEDDEDRKRNDVASQKPQEASASSEEPSPVVVPVAQEPQPVQPQASIVANSEGSDEEQEEAQPVEQAQQQSQSAVLNNKVSKNKQSNNAVVVPVNNVGKKKVVAAAAAAGSKVKSPGAIEALVPGYVTDQGEVLVPVDTVTGSQPITIVPDPFSPPSRIVSGPRPIPQSSVPATPSRQVPYWYRNSPNANPLISEPQAIGRQTLYSSVPPPGSIFTFDDDDDDDDADTPAVIPGNRLRQDEEDDDDDDDEDDEQDDESEENDENAKPVKKVPLAAVPAVGSSGEDDEAEALAFVNNGKPVSNRRPSTNAASSANKKPTGTSNAGAKQPSSNESESEEEESEEADVDSQEDDDDARSVAVPQNNRGRMYVDEDYVSFPPSRSPSVFAIVQGSFPQHQRRQQQPQYFSSAVPGNPYQRYVVRVTPSGNRPRPTQSLYYRPVESRPPNRRVVSVASFDVSVEDTRPSPSSFESDEEGVSVVPSGGPTPVTSFPFVYKVQGSLQGIPRPSGGPGLRPSRPPRPYYSSGPSGRPYGGSSPYASFVSSIYGPYGPPRQPYGAPRPPLGLSNGPPVIVRRKQPGGGPNRPPKPHLIAVYNPTGSSPSESGRPRPREPVDEEYYTFEVPSTNNKIVSSGPPKRPTVHRKPTPVIHQKLVAEDEEENSDESVAPAGPSPPGLPFKIIPQGTVRRRTVRGGKQLKPKKNSKKTASTKKQQQQDQQQDPLGILHKVNKSSNKSKLH